MLDEWLSQPHGQQHEDVQREELIEDVVQFFLRPVASRSVEPVCWHIDQYGALAKYFLTELPKHEKTMITIN